MDTYEMYYQAFEKTGSKMSVFISTEVSRCPELCDNSIIVSIMGGVPPYSVALSGVDVSLPFYMISADSSGLFRFNGLCAGLYNLTVSDLLKSEGGISIEITNPFFPIFLSIDSINNVSCNGNSDGSINLSISGGTEPFSYLWSTGETTEDLDSLKAGEYWVSITDGNGCIKSDTIILLEPPPVITGNIVGNATVIQSSMEIYFIDDTSNSIFNWEITGGDVISGQGLDSVKVQWGQVGKGKIKVVEIDTNGGSGDTVGLEVEVGSTDIRFNPEASLKIYPNPFTNTAILSISNPERNSYTLYLKDLSGKIVKTINNITERKTEITRDGLPAGLYLIELRGPNIYRGKIIIQ